MSETVKRDERRGGRWVEVDTITAKMGRDMIAASRARGGLERTSRVNPSITHGMGLDILERGIASYEPEQPILSIVAKNIQRETR